MIKILFVCHGNICRSPMAEFVLKYMASQAGLADKLFIDSAAASREELGNPIYPPARRELSRRGIPFAERYARQITAADLDKFDYIYYMDSRNRQYLQRMFPGHTDFRPLLDRDVADPYYCGGFDKTLSDITEGCERILEELKCLISNS